MLKRIKGTPAPQGVYLPIAEAKFPSFFYDGLQYSPPARGTWNIVHTNMLVPESHQIYICALGCLRGVVFTAAEMGALSRFSSIVVEEKHLFDGTMEDTVLRGTAEILSRLPKAPKACFIYPSCIHHFMGCDWQHVYKQLVSDYPHISFVPCWMDPIRRHSKLTAEMRTRRQIYSLLEKQAVDGTSLNMIGSNLPVRPQCELSSLLRANGYRLRQLPTCTSYEEYLAMGSSFLNIGQEPLAHIALAALEKRLGQQQVYLSAAWNYEEIEANLQRLAQLLQIAVPAYTETKQQCDRRLQEALKIVGGRPIAIDFTAVTRPFSLARLLLEQGFNVQRIYCDTAVPDDEADVALLQRHFPTVRVYAVRHAYMHAAARTDTDFLAIGQKAAYYTGTSHFVNIVEGGGWRDYAGIQEMARQLIKAVREEKSAAAYIQQKGWGCPTCL